MHIPVSSDVTQASQLYRAVYWHLWPDLSDIEYVCRCSAQIELQHLPFLDWVDTRGPLLGGLPPHLSACF